MSPSNPSELEPTPSPENKGENIVEQPEEIRGAEKKDLVEAKANSRDYRDSFIEREEPRWYTDAKRSETIEKEKMKFKEGLARNAKKIETGIKNLKEPVKRIEELPRLFRDWGLDEKAIHGFEKSLPKTDDAVPPENKHMAAAIFDAINELFKNKSFSEGSFSSMTLEIFNRERRATFVADQTTRSKYLDRIGEGFYRSKEGEATIRQYARAEAGEGGGVNA